MLKKIIISIIIILSITACHKEVKQFSLEDKFYHQSNFIPITSDTIPTKESYILYTYNNYCNFEIPCDTIFTSFMEKYQIAILSIPFEEFKNTTYYKTVKYAPSIIIIKNGKIVSYLDANSDDDIDKYQNTEKFTAWINKYISLEK